MDFSALADEPEEEPRAPPPLGRPARRRIRRDSGLRARMHQRLEPPRDEPVGQEEVLLEVELAIAAVEIAHAVVTHPMPQDEVLRPGRRTDRVGLDETHALEGPLERSRGEERPRGRMPPQVVETDPHASAANPPRRLWILNQSPRRRKT